MPQVSSKGLAHNASGMLAESVRSGTVSSQIVNVHYLLSWSQASPNGLVHHASGALAESVRSGTVSSSRPASHADLPPAAAARVVLIRCAPIALQPLRGVHERPCDWQKACNQLQGLQPAGTPGCFGAGRGHLGEVAQQPGNSTV